MIGQWPSVVDKGDEKVDKGGEKVAPEEKKKKKTRRLVATIQIRKKWFPSMILASLEAILSISDGRIALGILVYFLFKPEEYLTKW